MFRNYLKTSIRNLWKNKGFTAINIIGLATGLSVCLLIAIYVVDELNYDRYNKKADRIYRLDSDIFFNNTSFIATVSPEPMGPMLAKDFPIVEGFVRTHAENNITVKKDGRKIQDGKVVFADSTLFSVFTLAMLQGDPATALSQPKSLVVDETTARKYFNTTDVVGKTLTVNGDELLKITGVIKDMPRRSHFHFRFIRPFVDFRWRQAEDWLSNNSQTYVLLKPGATEAELQKSINKLVDTYMSQQLQAIFKSSMEEVARQGNYFRYHTMPLTDIHLYSDKQYELGANGDINYVYIFSVIAAFILLIACVNFMNLSTARSANRAKEVGIRKVAGSLRGHLITQFLVESLLVSFISMLIAIGLAVLLLPWFNQLAGKEMETSQLFTGWQMPLLASLVLVVGLLAGSYPAFYLSSFMPIQVLKGKIKSGFRASKLRSSLVVFQFSISIILIVGTIVIYNQLNYISNKKIGYNRDQVLVIHNTWGINAEKHRALRQALLGIPGVENVTLTEHIPTEPVFDQSAWFLDATMDAQKAFLTANLYVDENYVPTLGMEMVEGRNFSKDFISDSTSVILNEAAVKLLGWKEPLKEILYSPRYANYRAVPYRVIGVVKDFNFSSMRNKIGPLILVPAENRGKTSLKIASAHIGNTVQQVENTWKKMVPDQPFTYSFMDADFNRIYQSEQRTGKLFISFALFAIFIACLGLFGLVTYAAEQRTKEIGIRKVLGAGTGGLVVMLSKDFAKLVLIAAIISFPIAWLIMNKWLQDFAYRVSIGWWVFAIAGVAAISIALITVSFQAIRAALANPVAALRSE